MYDQDDDTRKSPVDDDEQKNAPPPRAQQPQHQRDSAAAAAPAVSNDSITSAQGRSAVHALSEAQKATIDPDVLDINVLRALGDFVQQQAVQNRISVRGVSKFAQSVNFLSEKLAKGPTSESGIKKLDLGLTTQIAVTSEEPSDEKKKGSDESAVAADKKQQQQQQPSPSSVSSPLRDSLFKAGESLGDVSRLLESIEIQSTRLVVAKKRREMLVQQRDRLLKVASKKNPAAFSENDAHGGANHNPPSMVKRTTYHHPHKGAAPETPTFVVGQFLHQ